MALSSQFIQPIQLHWAMKEQLQQPHDLTSPQQPAAISLTTPVRYYWPTAIYYWPLLTQPSACNNHAQHQHQSKLYRLVQGHVWLHLAGVHRPLVWQTALKEWKDPRQAWQWWCQQHLPHNLAQPKQADSQSGCNLVQACDLLDQAPRSNLAQDWHDCKTACVCDPWHDLDPQGAALILTNSMYLRRELVM